MIGFQVITPDSLDEIVNWLSVTSIFAPPVIVTLLAFKVKGIPVILISTEEEAVTKAEFKVKGEALIFTLALAVSVTDPLAKVKGFPLARWKLKERC